MKKLISLILLGSALSFNALSQDSNKISITPLSGQVYSISREEAEKEINKLSKKAEKEDAWLYHDEKLIDVGLWGTPFSVRIDSALVCNQNYEEGDSIWFYHNHPNLGEKNKCHPPGGLDIFLDNKIRRDLKSKKINLSSNAFDGIFKWTYSSSDTLENYPLFSEENERRVNNMDFIIGYHYGNSSLNKEISSSTLDTFVGNLAKIGIYIMYEKPNKP
jgi:hypothetical protein